MRPLCLTNPRKVGVLALLFGCSTTVAAFAQDAPADPAEAPEAEAGTTGLPATDDPERATPDAIADEPTTRADSGEAEAIAEAVSIQDDEGDAVSSASDQAATIAELQAAVEELKAKQEEAEMMALLEEEPIDLEQELLRVYGFMDMGFQKFWAADDALVSALFNTNASSFVTGNINLYFDANPHPDWRGLAEIRFTGAPLGNIDNFGGLGGDFQRRDTEQYDPHATVVNAPMWGGYTVIERAWVEWKKFQQVRVRVGNFFTPFGIWNVDHGSPTLISIALPQMIQQKLFPLRQTGLQLNGSFFVKDWELAYRAWLSNGRTEENLLDYDDDKAFGGRFFVRRDGGKVRTQIGASFHHGSVEDRVVDITGIPPITEEVTFEAYSTVAYTENVFGVDVSVDLNDTRIRSEFTSQLRQYEEGKRDRPGVTSAIPGASTPDQWRQAAYLLVAQQLPWWGLEPFVYGEVIRQDWELPGDAIATGSVGLNVRFNPSAMLKMQVDRGWFFKWKQGDDFPGDPSKNNVSTFVSRLVLAF